MTFLDRIDRWRGRWRESVAPRIDTTITVPPPPNGREAWRAAVVGVGGWGRAHAGILAHLEGVDLVAIADRNEALRSQLPDHLSPPRVAHFSDLDALLAAKRDLDFLSIATNTPSHTPLALAAVNAGVPHVVVEKPIGCGLDEVDHLLERAREQGTRLSVNLARRWSPDYRAIRDWLARSDLGPLRQITMTLGRGGFGMSGIHFLDLAAFFFGDPPARRAWGVLGEDETPALRGDAYRDPTGWSVVEFAGGRRLFIDLSHDLEKSERFFVLRTAHGRIEIDERAQRWTAVTAQGRRLRYRFRDATTAAAWARRHFAESLAGGPLACSGETGRNALEVVLAIHRAQATGKAVDLPLRGADRAIEVPFP